MNETFDILNLKNAKPSGQKLSAPKELAGLKPNKSLLHEVIRLWQANQRQGNASTKTRSDVRGGGRKPWKQKGTGRARSGSNRSPLWRKGGITFGPKPRDYSLGMPEAKRSLALTHAIANRLSQFMIFVKEEELNTIAKTKEAAAWLSALPKAKAASRYTLVVTVKPSESFYRACRNLQMLELTSAAQVNAYQVLKAGCVIMTDQAWTKYLETRYHGI